MSNFSEKLIYLRKRNGLSQKDLADKLGISRSTIGMYETGEREPSFEMLNAIAEIFDVSEDSLLRKPFTVRSVLSQPRSYPHEEDILALCEEFESLTMEEKETALNYIRNQSEQEKNKPAEPELDELDKELLRLAAQLTPEQKRRQVETLRDIVGKKDN